MSVMMTIDVEGKIVPDHYSVSGLLSSLRLFSDLDICGTFFVTGKFAANNRGSSMSISSDGHEVANHGYSHKSLVGLSNLELEHEIIHSHNILQKIAKKPVGFRAPYCSYSTEILSVLEKNGYLYDSSLHPAYIPFRYDNRKYPIIPFKKNGILVIPISVTPRLRQPIGWIWLRNLGTKWALSGARSLLRQGIDVVFYAHSWEFEDVSNLKNVSWLKRRRTGTKFEKMIEIFIISLLNDNYEFITMEEKARKWKMCV